MPGGKLFRFPAIFGDGRHQENYMKIIAKIDNSVSYKIQYSKFSFFYLIFVFGKDRN